MRHWGTERAMAERLGSVPRVAVLAWDSPGSGSNPSPNPSLSQLDTERCDLPSESGSSLLPYEVSISKTNQTFLLSCLPMSL